MKNKTEKIKSNDDYNYEGIENITNDVLKPCIDNKNNFDDIFQRIDILHKDYKSRTFFNDFSDFDNIFKSYFCGLQKKNKEK